MYAGLSDWSGSTWAGALPQLTSVVVCDVTGRPQTAQRAERGTGGFLQQVPGQRQ